MKRQTLTCALVALALSLPVAAHAASRPDSWITMKAKTALYLADDVGVRHQRRHHQRTRVALRQGAQRAGESEGDGRGAQGRRSDRRQELPAGRAHRE